jgi:hypothetical protein
MRETGKITLGPVEVCTISLLEPGAHERIRLLASVFMRCYFKV